MPAAPRPTLDYTSMPPYAELVADACVFYADAMEKTAQEIGQQRAMRTSVQMLRRAGKQTQALADALEKDEPQ